MTSSPPFCGAGGSKQDGGQLSLPPFWSTPSAPTTKWRPPNLSTSYVQTSVKPRDSFQMARNFFCYVALEWTILTHCSHFQQMHLQQFSISHRSRDTFKKRISRNFIKWFSWILSYLVYRGPTSSLQLITLFILTIVQSWTITDKFPKIQISLFFCTIGHLICPFLNWGLSLIFFS